MVGHSTGGGEVARYIGRYGTKRVSAEVYSEIPKDVAQALAQHFLKPPALHQKDLSKL